MSSPGLNHACKRLLLGASKWSCTLYQFPFSLQTYGVLMKRNHEMAQVTNEVGLCSYTTRCFGPQAVCFLAYCCPQIHGLDAAVWCSSAHHPSLQISTHLHISPRSSQRKKETPAASPSRPPAAPLAPATCPVSSRTGKPWRRKVLQRGIAAWTRESVGRL